MTLQGYYNRFNASDNYDDLLFRASRGLQSAELNEIQSVLSDRIQKIANVLFKDGSIVRDGAATIDAATGAVNMAAGAIYVKGAVREVSSATFTIPTTGTLSIGVRMTETEVTELEDPELRDPATGTRNYNEPGAGRTQRTIAWGWDGDGGTGTFYSIYSVENAALVTQVEPPQLDGVVQLIARYDRESNGNYAVRGLKTVSQGSDVTGNNYLFTITQGVGNVLGFKVDKPASTQKSFTKNPDLFTVNNEPHSSTGAGTQTVTLNYKPVNDIIDVVCTLEKTVTISHGAFTGAIDALPDTAVLSIQSVVQGGTTYTLGNDYNLTSDQVDWSPGGAEPAPGSTYTVTYRYLDSVTPANIDPDAGTFEVTGAVASTLILVDYRWKLPRYDLLTMDKEGGFHVIKGVSSRFTPAIPYTSVPESQLLLSSIYYDWFSTSTPKVEDIGTRVTDMDDLRRMKKAIVDLYDLVAIERLERDLASKEPTAKYGTFADPFKDDDLRDFGISQDAVVINNELQLKITGTQVSPTQGNDTRQTLSYTEAQVLAQDLRTGTMLINPYQSFDPVPALVSLDPSVDIWTVVDDVNNGTTDTQRTVIESAGLLFGGSWTEETLELIGSEVSTLEWIRSRTVNFTVSGFGAGEQLQSVTFAGEDVTPAGVVANGLGELSGSFTIPADTVPAGNVLVQFLGQGGSFGEAQYFAEGNLQINQWVTNRVTVTRFYDPLAQTFVLPEDRQISSVDLKFTQIGNVDNDVQVQIREVESGVPNKTLLGEAIINGADLTTNNVYVRATFGSLVHLRADTEYAIVVLTDDALHSVAVAELGRFDQYAQQWVTAQPYTVGTLLSSSNASTWTPHQEMDLTFRLNAAAFTATSRTVDLGQLTVTNLSDLVPYAPVYLPDGNCSVSFRYTRSTGEVFEMDNGTPVNLDAFISDTLTLQAVISGTSKLSPVFFPGMVTNVGTLDTAGTYHSRNFTLNSSGSTLKVYYDAQVSGTASVAPEYEAAGGTLTNMTLQGTSQVGDGWVEYVYSASAAGLTETAVKLSLGGTPQFRPKVRNLRAIYV